MSEDKNIPATIGDVERIVTETVTATEHRIAPCGDSSNPNGSGNRFGAGFQEPYLFKPRHDRRKFAGEQRFLFRRERADSAAPDGVDGGIAHRPIGISERHRT